MKKVILSSLVFGLMLATAGVVFATGTEKAGDENPRYLVKSNSGILKAVYGVHHNFDNGFTTELSSGQINLLQKLGVETEKVKVSYMLGVQTSQSQVRPSILDTRECVPSTRTPWGIAKVNGGSGGSGVIVAVLDSGVYKDHLDLTRRITYCKDFTVNERFRDTCVDKSGHGTHVAGTIAADGGEDNLGIYGVAPEAELMIIKVCKGACQHDDIATGIRYATDNGANIISISLGGPDSDILSEAIDYAIAGGVLIVSSAGNAGPDSDTVSYPASDPDVVAVAAFDELDSIADFSSRGVNNDDWVIKEREIEFAAPGVNVESTFVNGCYTIMRGTSMAAPHISGIAARDWQGSAKATRTYLQGLARTYTEDTTNGLDYGLSGDDIEAGFGLPIVLP